MYQNLWYIQKIIDDVFSVYILSLIYYCNCTYIVSTYLVILYIYTSICIYLTINYSKKKSETVFRYMFTQMLIKMAYKVCFSHKNQRP